MVSGLYSWLDSTQPRPQFVIPITDDPAKFKNLVADLLIARYESFSVCPPGTLPELEQLFQQQCRINGLAAQAIRPVVLTELEQSQFGELFNRVDITSKDVMPELQPEATRQLQAAYQRAPMVSWLILALIIGLSLTIGLLVRDRRYSFSSVGKRLLAPAVFIFVGGIIIRLLDGALLGLLNQAEAGIKQQLLNNAVIEFVQQLATQINNRWLLYSGVIILIGTTLILSQKLINKEPLSLLNRK